MTSRSAHASSSAKRGGLVRTRRTSGRGLPQRPRPLSAPAWRVIASSLAAFCGLAAVLAYVVAAGSGPAASSPGQAAYAGPNPGATKPVPQVRVAAPAVPVALPSTGAIPLPAGDQPQVTAWMAGSAGAALSVVTGQAGDVAQARGLRQYAEMRQYCSELASSVSAAQADAPIPDAAMQAQYQKALSELAKAAETCQAGISRQSDGGQYVATTENRADLSASASALASGSMDLYQATGQISDLGQGS
jgi:hypothetical protein